MRPTEASLVNSSKIRNTQLHFVFLCFFSCVIITSVGLKFDRQRCTIDYCYTDSQKRFLISTVKVKIWHVFIIYKVEWFSFKIRMNASRMYHVCIMNASHIYIYHECIRNVL